MLNNNSSVAIIYEVVRNTCGQVSGNRGKLVHSGRLGCAFSGDLTTTKPTAAGWLGGKVGL